jgi:hypothetical protein
MGPIPDRIIAALTYESVIDREMIALICVFLTTTRARKRKNAFKVIRSGETGGLLSIVLTVIISGVDHFEKIGRRKLLVVADNNDLFCARDDPERILRRDLTGFIDDKQVETKQAPWKELSYRQGTHQEHRL